MAIRSSARRPDVLTTLLFRLPAELRLQIYEHLIPDAKILLIPDSAEWLRLKGTPGEAKRRPFRWLTVSRAVFLDAGSLLYGSKPLYFWIDAWTKGRGKILDDALQYHAKCAHPEDTRWMFDVIRSSMLTKIMLEVHATTFGEDLQSVLLRFTETTFQLRRYAALEELCISLRPHYNNAHHKALFNTFKASGLRVSTIRESWTLRRLCRAVRQIKSNVPSKCKVKWYIPGDKPRVSCVDGLQVTDSEKMIVIFMGTLCAFVCKHTDDELDEVLSERDSKVAWPAQQHK